jgi:diguanylate cyclase (GGDEF)-like protein
MDFIHIDCLNQQTLEQLERFTFMPIVVFDEHHLLYSNIYFQDAIKEENIDPIFNNLYHDVDIKNLTRRQEIKVKNSFGEMFYFDTMIKQVLFNNEPAFFALLTDISDRRLYEENLTQISKLRALIAEISQSILDSTDLNSFYNFVLNTTLKALDKSTLGTILLLEDTHFVTVASVGYSSEVFDFKLPLSESFIYRETNGAMDRIINIRDTTKLSYYIPVTTDYGEEIFIKSALSAPIYFQGKLYGLINLDSLSKDAFTEDDIQSIEFISKSIEIAITNRLLYEEKVHLSRFDALTGLYNRHFFDEYCDTVIKKSSRYEERFHLVMIDVDDLKIINDEYSHLVGDEIISRVAMLLNQNMRDSDIFARYGGDEFIGLLFNAKTECLVDKFELINEELKKTPFEYQGSLIYTSISFGIAIFNDDGSSIYDLIKVADDRMYAYKKEHKKALEL